MPQDNRTADQLTAARAHPHCPECKLVIEDCRCNLSDILNELADEMIDFEGYGPTVMMKIAHWSHRLRALAKMGSK